MGEAWRVDNSVSVIAPFTLKDFNLSLSRPNRLGLKKIFKEVWSFKSPDPNYFERVPKSFPITDGERVYFGSDRGEFWALNAYDGTLSWSHKVSTPFHKNIWSAPALHEGKVFFGAYDGYLYCLDSATGKEIWRCLAADWIGSSPALAPELGLLFIGLEYATEGSKGAITAFNIQTGQKVWEHGTKRFTHASPAYSSRRKLVACGSNDDELFLLDATNGTVRWRFQTRAEGLKGSIRHAPAFDEKRGCVITGCADGNIYVVDIKSGEEVWSVRTVNSIYTIPLVVGDLAFIGSTDKYMYILDLKTKKVKHKLFAGSLVFCPPRLIKGRVYFGSCSGIIYEINLKPLSITGNYQLPDAVTNAIAFSEATGLFYVLTYTNQLFALKPLPRTAV
jgi:outer membrane protein assembly factor BamB